MTTTTTPDPDNDPTVPTPLPPAEPAPAPAEEPAPEPEEEVTDPGTPAAKEEDLDTAAANLALIEAPKQGTGDVVVGVIGDTTGWFVVGKSPRKPEGKRWGPYGMMEALSKANQLRAKLHLEGRLATKS